MRSDSLLSRIGTVLFTAGLALEILVVILDKSAFLFPYESQVFRLTFLLFALSVLCGRRGLREIPVFLAFCALGLAVWRIGGRNDVLRLVVFVFACRGQDTDRALRLFFLETGAGMAALAALAAANVLGTVTFTGDLGRGTETLLCLGMGHPNALHCMAAMWLALGLYLYGDRAKWIPPLVFACNLALFAGTHSRSSFLAAAAVSAVYMLLSAGFFERGRKRAEIFTALLAAVLAGGLALSVAGAVCNPRDHFLLRQADRILTGRIASLWDTTFHEGTLSTWHLFGSRLNEAYFDLGYVRLVYWYGTVFAAAVLIVTCLWIARLHRRGDLRTLVLLLVLLIYTVFEAHLVSAYLGRNFLLILLAGKTAGLFPDSGAEKSH